MLMTRSNLPAAIVLLTTASHAGDWPQWCGTYSKNMVSTEKNLPVEFSAGKRKKGTEEVDVATTVNCRWVVKLGSQSYGTPAVAGGKILVGTNNENPRDPTKTGDRAIIMCVDEKTGAFQWQLVVPKLGAGKVSDWEYLGMCTTPFIEGDRAYLVTNRCEIVCIDMNGMANGNDGPFKDEVKYFTPGAAPGQPAPEAATVNEKDGDVIWRYDMREELGVFPHNITSSSVIVAGDRVYATTSAGVDWSHTNLPNPQAPTFICLDKKTGEYLGEETSKIGERVMHCNWSSPAYAQLESGPVVVFGAGDGFVYGFDPVPKKGSDDINILQEVFRFDCVPKELRVKEDGSKRKYADADGPSEIISTPVVYRNRVYVAIGQDPEHGEGKGCLSCIDITKRGDISQSGLVWRYKELERSISTVSIADGLIYIADYSGRLHCIDAETAKKHWVYDTKGHLWSSTLVADGKVYLGNEEGELTILAAGKEMKKLGMVEFPAPLMSSPVAANGQLLVTTMTHIYCFAQGGKPVAKND
jgi:outer membrane protein assembly factor BamB